MWGAVLRSALVSAAAALIAAVLSYILARLLPLMGPDDGLLYRSFASISDHALAVMILAILAGLIGRAVVESTPGR
jgi:H+/Cl- antiporter ClcA